MSGLRRKEAAVQKGPTDIVNAFQHEMDALTRAWHKVKMGLVQPWMEVDPGAGLGIEMWVWDAACSPQVGADIAWDLCRKPIGVVGHGQIARRGGNASSR
jgi:hypothetical protein